jgi:hypothetical protein
MCEHLGQIKDGNCAATDTRAAEIQPLQTLATVDFKKERRHVPHTLPKLSLLKDITTEQTQTNYYLLF